MQKNIAPIICKIIWDKSNKIQSNCYELKYEAWCIFQKKIWYKSPNVLLPHKYSYLYATKIEKLQQKIQP